MSENSQNKEVTSGQNGLTQVPQVKFHGKTNESRYLLSFTDEAIHTVALTLAEEGKRSIANEIAAAALPFSNPEFLHQGDEVSGNKQGERRWIAVILHEDEIRQACESRGIRFDTLDMDTVVKRYTDALVGDGGWYESLKMIVTDEGREEDEGEQCPECGNKRETVYVPVCDRNPQGLASKTPEEHGNIQDDGTVLCEDGYCNPREITLAEFNKINKEDSAPQDVIVRCYDCGAIKE